MTKRDGWGGGGLQLQSADLHVVYTGGAPGWALPHPNAPTVRHPLPPQLHRSGKLTASAPKLGGVMVMTSKLINILSVKVLEQFRIFHYS